MYARTPCYPTGVRSPSCVRHMRASVISPRTERSDTTVGIHNTLLSRFTISGTAAHSPPPTSHTQHAQHTHTARWMLMVANVAGPMWRVHCAPALLHGCHTNGRHFLTAQFAQSPAYRAARFDEIFWARHAHYNIKGCLDVRVCWNVIRTRTSENAAGPRGTMLTYSTRGIYAYELVRSEINTLDILYVLRKVHGSCHACHEGHRINLMSVCVDVCLRTPWCKTRECIRARLREGMSKATRHIQITNIRALTFESRQPQLHTTQATNTLRLLWQTPNVRAVCLHSACCSCVGLHIPRACRISSGR